MGKVIFGFDIGIASIGWAVVNFKEEVFNSETGEITKGQILSAGVRCFSKAENPKDGKSLAAPRREKRLARRTCRRKARRMQSLKALFIKKGFISETELTVLYNKAGNKDVWKLRVEALSRLLTTDEFLRVLTHLAKHRGFKSYRQSEDERDIENFKILKAIEKNKQALDNCENYETLAQVIVKNAANGPKRNRSEKVLNKKGELTEQVSYHNSIPRDEIIKESELIFLRQKEFGLSIATLDFFEEFYKIAFRHRPLSSVGDMVGYCQFEISDEDKNRPKRAPKEAPSVEIFVALQKINNLKIYDGTEERFLNSEERMALLDLLRAKSTVKYSTIHKEIFKNKQELLFSAIDYAKKIRSQADGKERDPEDEKFYSLKGWHELKKAISSECGDAEWRIISESLPLLDNIVTIIAIEKNDEIIKEKLEALALAPVIIKAVAPLSFKKFGHLSLKAIYKLNPELLNGKKYHEACKSVGYDFQSMGEALLKDKSKFLAAIDQDKLTTVPTVNRAIAQFRKVYNAMVRIYGLPDQINIEMARDIYHSHDERKRIEKGQKAFRDEKETAAERARELGIDPNQGHNLLKFRLYEQQDSKCLYSGKVIDTARLVEQGYCEIDHILPYSRSLDDSINNKVLCLTTENQNKRDQIPFEYLGVYGEKWNNFVALVNTSKNLNKAKKNRLLRTSFTDEEASAFRERNLNDTRYMSRYIKRYLEEGVDFSDSRSEIKNRIQTRNGALTDFLRHQWGLSKDRGASDTHHAMDAIVIACATQGMVKYLSVVSGLIENKYNFLKNVGDGSGEAWYKSLKIKFKEPWTGFRQEVLEILNGIFVSRAPEHTVTGPAHEDTIRTLNRQHKNYNEKDIKSGVLIRGGKASNGKMVRTDVFTKENRRGESEFYLVPIYVSDTLKPELPNKAIVAHKTEDQWVEVDNTFTFKFSLFLNDLICVKNGDKEILGYFKGTHRGNGSISIGIHDNSAEPITGIGVRTLDSFKKYQVDPLGRFVEVKSEKRLSFKKQRI